MNKLTIPAGTWPGLAEAIVAAGHSFECRDGNYYSNSDEAQSIIDGYTSQHALEAAKAELSAAVSLRAKALRDSVIATISAGELASWAIKRAEAAQFRAIGLPEYAPMLSAEAAARGITLLALVTKVEANSAFFMAMEAQISGTDGKHRDAISQLLTVADVLAYDASAGWPG